MKTNRTVIVQCRLSSTRLPGKALKDLGGKSVLARVLSSMKNVKAIHQIFNQSMYVKEC